MLRSIHDEEYVNAATHGLGLACSIAAAALLLSVAGEHAGVWETVGCAIYAATLVGAYAASTLSHVFRDPQLRHRFRISDQAVIFLLIAGTYTPFALTYLRGGAWWMSTALIGTLALIGFFSKAVFAHRVRLGAVSVLGYLVLGWLTLPAILIASPVRLMVWLIAGGLLYMGGTVFFYFDDRVRYFHATWHAMVVAGSACHFLGILFYCTGTR
jgi:hemolysin III